MSNGVGVYATPARGDLPLELQMMRLASGHLAAQAVHVFAVLGIADMLSDGPMSIREIATRAQVQQEPMYRLMRFLATLDVVEERDDASFALTRLGGTLRRRTFAIVRNSAALIASPGYWSCIGGLLRNVQTGQTAFEAIHGRNYFGYLADHPEEAAAFNDAMASGTQMTLPAILSAYDFSTFRCIVDVGGGTGLLLEAILRKYPNVHGVLFDSEAVVDDVAPDPQVRDRLRKVGGSFFDSVPAGGDAYILRRVLHDWNDENALEILRQCRKVMSADAKLLVIEAAASSLQKDWVAQDLLMMVLTGGRERTDEELRHLLSSADFTVTRVIHTTAHHWIVEAVPSAA